jgi:hypothetical protein
MADKGNTKEFRLFPLMPVSRRPNIHQAVYIRSLPRYGRHKYKPYAPFKRAQGINNPERFALIDNGDGKQKPKPHSLKGSGNGFE